MLQRMVTVGGSGGKDFTPTFVSQMSSVDAKAKIYDEEFVCISGNFVVNSQTPNSVFLTGLPAPSVQRVVSASIKINGTTVVSDVTINTSGTATATSYSFFSAGYTWVFDGFCYGL